MSRFNNGRIAYGCPWVIAFFGMIQPAFAGTIVTLPRVDISTTQADGTQDEPSLADAPLSASSPDKASQRMSRLSSPDSASLLQNLPGVSTYGGGRLANLPVLNGMADDRVATVVDGVRIAPACPNHMNPALST